MAEFDPSGDSASIVSVTDKVRPVAIGAPVIAVHFLGDRAAFVGAEENVALVDGAGEISRVEVHSGGILCVASDGERIVMGGDDGKLVSLGAKGEVTTLATDPKRRWIDNVALHPEGAVAWSAGKVAFVRGVKGDEKSFEVPSTVGGLAFAPKGMRLAIAHYNGVTLWFPNMAGSAQFLEWAGSHLGVVFSPDNKFLVTTMHEAALHGWRLADNRHMRMTGYPGRVRSLSWTAGGKALATSGADTVILWPFASKDGPMGKEPAMLAPLQARVTQVACHPKQDIFAAGYSDGTILMVRINDGAEILVHSGAEPVSALAWNAKGTMLAFAAEDGDAGLLEDLAACPLILPKLGYIIPDMGTMTAEAISLSNALFSKVQQRVLGLIFGQPERSFYMSEIIRTVRSGTGAVERELSRLQRSGLVSVERIGNQKHYRANHQSPIFTELQSLVIKTVALTEPLRRSLEPCTDRIKAAFVYGSVAKGADTAHSDIDLMVIGDTLNYVELYAALQDVETALGRKVSPTFLSMKDWRRKASDKGSFISKVNALPKIFVFGSEQDLQL